MSPLKKSEFLLFIQLSSQLRHCMLLFDVIDVASLLQLVTEAQRHRGGTEISKAIQHVKSILLFYIITKTRYLMCMMRPVESSVGCMWVTSSDKHHHQCISAPKTKVVRPFCVASAFSVHLNWLVKCILHNYSIQYTSYTSLQSISAPTTKAVQPFCVVIIVLIQCTWLVSYPLNVYCILYTILHNKNSNKHVRQSKLVCVLVAVLVMQYQAFTPIIILCSCIQYNQPYSASYCNTRGA